jgi:hypothetical protein
MGCIGPSPQAHRLSRQRQVIHIAPQHPRERDKFVVRASGASERCFAQGHPIRQCGPNGLKPALQTRNARSIRHFSSKAWSYTRRDLHDRQFESSLQAVRGITECPRPSTAASSAHPTLCYSVGHTEVCTPNRRRVLWLEGVYEVRSPGLESSLQAVCWITECSRPSIAASRTDLALCYSVRHAEACTPNLRLDRLSSLFAQ